MARKLLVVATVEIAGESIQEEIRRHTGGEEVDVRVVAPATELSPLQWLANEEDDARARAEQRAEEMAAAADSEATRVEASVGDTDPVQAIEDMLRDFPAEEIILVTHRGGEESFLEEDAEQGALDRFGLPVTHLTV